MKKVAIAFGVFLLIFTGCYRTKKSVNVDRQVEWAYHLIDQGHYTAAIDIFWQLRQHDDSPTIRIGLASALAARAGVRVHSYWDLAMPSVNTPPPAFLEATIQFRKQWTERIQLLPPHVQKQVAPKTEEIVAAQEKVETLKWRFQQIPLLERMEQRNDIALARDIIKDIPNRGIHLYRALLTLVLFRYDSQIISLEFNQGLVTSNAWPCSDSLHGWIQHLPPLLDLISDVTFDLKLAFPHRSAELAPFETDVENFRNQFLPSQTLLENTLCSTQ